MINSSPTETEWEEFNHIPGHRCKFRGLNDNIHIRELRLYSKDQHATIIEAERVKAKREFTMPPQFTTYKNPVVSHCVQVKMEMVGEESFYFIRIDTVVKIRYVKIQPMQIANKNHRHVLD